MAILKIWDKATSTWFEVPIEDPTLYLLLDGLRAMTGPLNMGANAIINVGNVDGRDVSVDGAKLDIALTAAGVIADHAIVRGDGGARGTQGSTPTISDAGDLNMGLKDIANINTVRDPLGNEQLDLGFVIFAVNHVVITNAATGSGPIITSQGDDPNVDLLLATQGTGTIKSLDDFDVTGNITLTGTVDGVDIAGLAGTVVTAAAVIADNCLVRGDSGVRGVQASGVIVSDANAMSGVTTLACSQSIVSPAIFGGAGAGDDLVITSTSHATIGKIYFGAPPAATGVWDETKPALGIGTTDPGGIISTDLLSIRQDSERATMGIYTSHNTASRGSSIYGARSRGTIGSETVVQDGDTLFAFVALGYDGAAWDVAAHIFFKVDGTPSSGAMPTSIAFRTGPTTPADRFTIQADGDILVDSGTSVFVRDSALGFNSSVDGQLDLFADTEIEFTTATIDLGFANVVSRGTNGFNIAPGLDIDADLITVDVTGAPKQWWDESENAFAMTHRLILPEGVQTKYAVNDVADPPTDAELDTAFGDPTVVGSGFVGILDDNDAGTDCYVCWTTGTAGEWFYTKGTKAI